MVFRVVGVFRGSVFFATDRATWSNFGRRNHEPHEPHEKEHETRKDLRLSDPVFDPPDPPDPRSKNTSRTCPLSLRRRFFRATLVPDARDPAQVRPFVDTRRV